jgi:PKD repeat protein
VFQVKISMKAIRFILFTLILLVSSGIASAATISIDSAHVAGPGSEADLTLYLDYAADGLSGYELTITLDNPAVAEIVAVEFPSWAVLNEHPPLPAGSVTIRAADVNEQIQECASDIPLVTITIRAKDCGSTGVVMTIQSLEDEDGIEIPFVIIQDAIFTAGLLQPPQAGFSAVPSSGDAPLTVNYFDQSIGVVTDYYWDFGDGFYAVERNPSHTYLYPGNYTTYLTTYNEAGSSMTDRAITVTGSPLIFSRELGNGWNILSTPVLLDPGNDTFSKIFPVSGRESVQVIIGWDGTKWFIPEPGYRLLPLDAVLVKVAGSADAVFTPSSSLSGPPARSLSPGLSLIGTAPAESGGVFPAMPVSESLVSIEYAPGGLYGYTMVISPPYNQPAWTYVRNGSVRDVLPFRGYWVIMENPDMLYGFSTTPLV